MSDSQGVGVKGIVINGWTIFAHPVFLNQIEQLVSQVELQRQKDSTNYRKKNSSKRLAAIFKLAFEVIPQDPSRAEYRQGEALGNEHKHWFRAKFFQQYRLFFRYHGASKIILFAWVNDEDTKRAYQSNDDAYKTFRKMLEAGNPPDDWKELISESIKDAKKLQDMIGGAGALLSSDV